jgi:hypothetical protein
MTEQHYTPEQEREREAYRKGMLKATGSLLAQAAIEQEERESKDQATEPGKSARPEQRPKAEPRD